MANTTSVIDMEKVYRANECQITPGQDAQSEEMLGTITIEVRGGCVIDVRGLPESYDYEVLDHDVGYDPEPEGLYLAAVNLLVRSTSPDHAADTVNDILTTTLLSGGTLIDWDYAVQDGERQFPKCISLDLEPENITELLDHIAQ